MNTNEIKTKIKKTADNLELRSTRIASWLKILAERGEMGNEEFTQLTGLPQTHTGRLLEAVSEMLEPSSQNVVVRESVTRPLRKAAKDLKPKVSNEVKIRIKKTLRKYRQSRRPDKRELDQFKATEETVIRRVEKMLKEGDIQDRSVLVLGDNDLTSIGIGLTNEAQRTVALDIDEETLETIKRIAQEREIQIETIQHDLRKPLPQQLQAKFDTVITDPPYTIKGVGTFVNRAIEAMKERLDARIYLCYGNSDRAREREIPIQQEITNRGLLIHEKDFQFNVYNGARSIGSRSSLFLLDWTPKTRIFFPQGKKFYTHE